MSGEGLSAIVLVKGDCGLEITGSRKGRSLTIEDRHALRDKAVGVGGRRRRRGREVDGVGMARGGVDA